MCDNAGIDDTKITVYSVKDDNTAPDAIIFDHPGMVSEYIRTEIELADVGHSFNYEITVKQMTVSEFEALPQN